MGINFFSTHRSPSLHPSERYETNSLNDVAFMVAKVALGTLAVMGIILSGLHPFVVMPACCLLAFTTWDDWGPSTTWVSTPSVVYTPTSYLPSWNNWGWGGWGSWGGWTRNRPRILPTYQPISRPVVIRQQPVVHAPVGRPHPNVVNRPAYQAPVYRPPVDRGRQVPSMGIHAPVGTKRR